jgi:hypothetical protein
VSPRPEQHGPHGQLHSCRYHSPAGHPIEAEKADKALEWHAETSRRKIRKITETLDIGGDDI